MMSPGAVRPLCRVGAAIWGSHTEPYAIRQMNQGRAKMQTEHSSHPETHGMEQAEAPG